MRGARASARSLQSVAVVLLLVLPAGCAHERAVSPTPANPEVASPVAREVEFRAWATGDEGLIIAYSPEDAEWKPVDTDLESPAPVISGIAFADGLTGWAVGSEGTILHSRDGGLTWVRQQSGLEGSQETLTGVACRGPLDAWVVGPGSALHTTDGGRRWQLIESDGALPGPLVKAHEIVFATPEVGWAIRGLEVLATKDGGATWDVAWRQPRRPSSVMLSALACADEAHVFAGGGRMPSGATFTGALVGSADGGSTWKRRLETPEEAVDIACVGARRRWVVAGGDLYGSRDGGAHWRRQSIPGGAVAKEVAFADRLRGWLIAELKNGDEAILATTDGGATWRRQRIGAAIPSYLTDVVALKQ